MALGKKLKELLQARNITVTAFAQQIGVPATTLYSFIQRDSDDVRLDFVHKICTGLSIDTNEFLGDTLSQNNTSIDTKVKDIFINVMEQQGIPATQVLLEADIKTPGWETRTFNRLNTYYALLAAKNTSNTTDKLSYTAEELDEIQRYADYLKSKRT